MSDQREVELAAFKKAAEHWEAEAARQAERVTELEAKLNSLELSRQTEILSNTRDVFRGTQVMELFEGEVEKNAALIWHAQELTQINLKLVDTLKFLCEHARRLDIADNHQCEANWPLTDIVDSALRDAGVYEPILKARQAPELWTGDRQTPTDITKQALQQAVANLPSESAQVCTDYFCQYKPTLAQPHCPICSATQDNSDLIQKAGAIAGSALGAAGIYPGPALSAAANAHCENMRPGSSVPHTSEFRDAWEIRESFEAGWNAALKASNTQGDDKDG